MAAASSLTEASPDTCMASSRRTRLIQRFGAEHVVHVVDGGVPKLGQRGVELAMSEQSAAAA